MRFAILLLACAATLAAQKYTGPRPPKPDVLYLVHADNLVPTEITEANEEKKKDDIIATVQGASSPARTPLAEPIFLIEADKLVPDKFELYKLESKNGRREVTLPATAKRRKNAAEPVRISITRLEGRLYRVEASEILEPGEYGMSPAGTSTVFCFQVY